MLAILHFISNTLRASAEPEPEVMFTHAQMCCKIFSTNMEGNKDEAVKCLEFARRFLAKGDREKAKKFILKSKKLYPLEEAENLLQSLDETGSTKNGHIPNGSSSTHECKSSNSSRHTSKEDVKKEPDYTPEQLAEVRRVNELKDYYEILGVPKEASDAELKKSYKKLALLCHPDKNRAPGSTDAFKAIGNSFAILNDPEKRKRYDKYGHDSPMLNHNHSHNHYQDFEADITPEDLFNMFFGGAAGNRVYIHRPRRRRRYHEEQENEGPQNGVGSIMHLIPILIFLGLSLLTSLMVQDPPYSFSISGPYRLHKVTHKHSISYYVQNDFEEKYKGKTLSRLESQIESEYLGRLRSACYREKQIREDLYSRGRFWRDHSLIRRAEEMSMESCDELTRIRNR